jgi:bacillithiol system protein YtxJ
MRSWKQIQDDTDVLNIVTASLLKPQIIFKDSLTCGRSAFAKEKLGDGEALLMAQADVHYLDLLQFRSVSNFIAASLGVQHQSPQILVLKQEKVVYHVSHEAIEPMVIAKHL